MILFLIIVIVIAMIVQQLSLYIAKQKNNIRYSCKPSVEACEPDTEFLVYSTVTNSSRFPSPVLRIEERFPKSLNVLEATEFNVNITGDYRIYNSTVSMRGRQRVRRYLRASLPDRGAYVFSFAEFHAGDFMGIKEFDYFKDNQERIVIYPRAISNEGFLKTFTNALEDIALKRRLLEDPISVCGYRDYTGREPMRSISWKQSAARNSLIVKEFDPTWRQAVTIVMDMQYHGEHEFHSRRQEYCFSMARTICEYLEDKNFEYRLVTNAIVTSGISSFYSSGGRGFMYEKILYALGSAKNGNVCTLEELLANACTGAYRERVIILITTRKTPEVLDTVMRVSKESGSEVVPLYASDYINAETEEAG